MKRVIAALLLMTTGAAAQDAYSFIRNNCEKGAQTADERYRQQVIDICISEQLRRLHPKGTWRLQKGNFERVFMTLDECQLAAASNEYLQGGVCVSN